MPLVGAAINGEAVPWKDIPPALFQPEFVKAMQHEYRGGVHLSDLIGCPYDAVRKKRYNFYLPLNNLYFMVRGKAWDALVEKYPVPGRESQKRLCRTLDGVEIYGTPDIIDFTRMRIEDNKSPVKLKGYQEIPLSYALQVNGYRWLIAGSGHDIGELRLNTTAHFGFEQLEVPVFELDEVEEELSMRLHMLMEVAALNDVVPQCKNPKCYCYSDGFMDTNKPHKWGVEEMRNERPTPTPSELKCLVDVIGQGWLSKEAGYKELGFDAKTYIDDATSG